MSVIKNWRRFFCFFKMATLRIERKLAGINRDKYEHHPRKNQLETKVFLESRKIILIRYQKKFESRVTKKLSREFNTTENCIWGALSQLDKFFQNPQSYVHSGAVPEASLNINRDNQGTHEDRSQNDSHLEGGVSLSHSSQKLSPEETSNMVTGVHKKILYRSPGTCPGKQKKARSTSQPQIQSEITAALPGADQNLLVLQKMTSNSNSANFNNANPICKMPKPLTRTMPTFDRKSEKFEVFEGFFEASLKIPNQLTDENRIKVYIFSRGPMRCRHSKTLAAQPNRTGTNSSSFPQKKCQASVNGHSKT